jgi:hypothetical protein
MSNRLVSKDVSDNIIAGAVMALSSMKNMSLKFVTYKDANNVTVGFSGCLIPIKMGDYWGLIDTATDVHRTTNLDTGSIAPNTTYYVYAVTNGSVISFKTSVNSSAPTGYTTSTSEKLGGFTTDGSSNVNSATVWDVKTSFALGINTSGTVSININGTVGATIPTTGAFTTATVSTAIVDNDATTQLATTAFVKSQDAILARDPDQGVTMTAAASGSSGITVADNDNVDFGTGNFALVWKGSLPDWTPSAEIYLMSKYTAADDKMLLSITTSGYIKLWLDGNTYTGATAVGSIDGTMVDLVVVCSRQSASVAGSATVYRNGVLHETITLAAGAVEDLSNSATLYISGTSSARTASTVHHAYTLNFAPTAAEVLDLYRNGIPESWKWGNQTNMAAAGSASDPVEVDAITGWSASGATTVDTSTTQKYIGAKSVRITGVDAQYDGMRATATMVVGKKYRLTLAFFGDATAAWIIRYYTDTAVYVTTGTTNGQVLPASWTTHTVEFTAVGTSFTLDFITGTGVTSSGAVYIDNVSLVEIGATLALTPEGIQPSPGQWLDSSSNKLHAMQPATGSSLTRYKKDFEYRWTNTWTASSAAQYVGGLNQAVLSADHFITDIITQATVVTDVENLELGDGSAVAKFVAAFTPSATRTKQTVAAQNDGTNLKLVYTPAASATMTVETIIRGFIWES